MKSLLLSLSAIIVLSFSAAAQMPYSLTVYNQAYVPLDSATLIDSGQVWNLGSNFAAPIGFPFMIDTFHCTNFFSEGAGIAATDTTDATFSGFVLTDASLDDKGFVVDTQSISPVRYKLTGATGHRIFKWEVSNAGFDQQFSDLGYMTDSVSMQVWYYEDSNIVELRYGPSYITGTDYFILSNTIVGFLQNLDSAGNGTLYALGGSPASPMVQTVDMVDGNPTSLFSSLSSFPPSGTVYRFAPRSPISEQVKDIATGDMVSIYPTATASQITLNNKGKEKLQYTVVSVNGAQTGISGSADKGITRVDVSALPAGMYLVEVRGAAENKVCRFVKM